MTVVYTGMYRGERFNSISHLIGAALALAGGVVLVTLVPLVPWDLASVRARRQR